MESSYSANPCTRDCKNRCVDRQREAAIEYRKDILAKKKRVYQTKMAAGLYR